MRQFGNTESGRRGASSKAPMIETLAGQKPTPRFARILGQCRTIQGYEAINMIRKGQIRWVSDDDALRQIRFIKKLFGRLPKIAIPTCPGPGSVSHSKLQHIRPGGAAAPPVGRQRTSCHQDKPLSAGDKRAPSGSCANTCTIYTDLTGSASRAYAPLPLTEV